MDYTVHGILQARALEIEPRSPALQVDSLPAELQANNMLATISVFF